MFQVGDTSWPFEKLKVLGNRGEEADPLLNVRCEGDNERPGREGYPLQPLGAPPRSLVLQIVFERLRQGQGADVLQTLAAQGRADGSPAQVHQRQGLGCNEREAR